jgi:WD40 repeat protein
MKVVTKNKFIGHKDAIFSLGFEAESEIFYSGAGDGFIVEWKLDGSGDGKLICKLPRPVYTFKILRELSILLAGTASGNLHVIDLKSSKEIKNIEAHTLGLYSIETSGDKLITAGGDGLIRIWSLLDFSLLQTLSYSNKSARTIALKPDGTGFSVGYSDCMIREFVWGNPAFFLESFLAHENSVFSILYHPITSNIISGGRDAMLKIWNHSTLLKEIPAHNYHINDIKMNPSCNLIATVSMDKSVKIWDSTSYQLLKVIDRFKQDCHSNSVNKVIWVNDKELITCGDDKLLFQFEVEDFN